MTFASGWYTDPAGLAHLRFWDGQNWTTATAPAAGAPVAQPVRVPVANALVRRSPARSKSFYGAIAGVAALVAISAAVVPLALSSGHHTTSTTPAATGPVFKPGSIHLPATFAGLPRVTGAASASMRRGFASSWPFRTPFIAGGYGWDGHQPHVAVEAGNVSLNAVGIAGVIHDLEQAVNQNPPRGVFHNEPVGLYGGTMRCAMSPQSDVTDPPGAVCLFADSTTFGITYSAIGTRAASLRRAIELRSAVETAPLN